MENRFRDLRKTEDERNRRERSSKMDGLTDAEYNKLKAREERIALLDGLVPDRRCPLCDQVKVKSRQWVVFRHARLQRFRDIFKPSPDGRCAVCRSCAMKYLKKDIFSR